MTYAQEFALHCAWMVPACFAIGYGMAAVRDWWKQPMKFHAEFSAPFTVNDLRRRSRELRAAQVHLFCEEGAYFYFASVTREVAEEMGLYLKWAPTLVGFVPATNYGRIAARDGELGACEIWRLILKPDPMDHQPEKEEMTKPVIQPTIGRRVLLFVAAAPQKPAGNQDRAEGPAINNPAVPFDAGIAYVWGDSDPNMNRINVGYTDHNGKARSLTSVPLFDRAQNETDKHGAENYAVWMPYQFSAAMGAREPKPYVPNFQRKTAEQAGAES